MPNAEGKRSESLIKSPGLLTRWCGHVLFQHVWLKKKGLGLGLEASVFASFFWGAKSRQLCRDVQSLTATRGEADGLCQSRKPYSFAQRLKISIFWKDKKRSSPTSSKHHFVLWLTRKTSIPLTLLHNLYKQKLLAPLPQLLLPPLHATRSCFFRFWREGLFQVTPPRGGNRMGPLEVGRGGQDGLGAPSCAERPTRVISVRIRCSMNTTKITYLILTNNHGKTTKNKNVFVMYLLFSQVT